MIKTILWLLVIGFFAWYFITHWKKIKLQYKAAVDEGWRIGTEMAKKKKK